MTPVARIYENELIQKGVLTEETVQKMKDNIKTQLEKAYAESKDLSYKAEDWVTEEWEAIKKVDRVEAKNSGCEVQRIKNTGKKITTLPDDG